MANDSPFFRMLKRIWQKEETWPPNDRIKDHWAQIESYRRRYRNNKEELLEADPNINIDEHKVGIYTPIPWARELCRFSAALLFSETPQVTFDAQKALLEKLQRVNDFGAFAIEGGVKVACDGRLGIRIIYDHDISRVPLLTLVDEDQIVWDERHGRFIAGGMVVIERRPQVSKDDKTVYRLLESHSAGIVERTLYKGWDNELGKAVPLSTLHEFKDLQPEVLTGLDHPTLVPWDNVPGAESDLFGLGPLLDDVNEAESLLLDKGRKSIPRVFVDRSLADETGRIEIDGYMLTGGSRMRPALGQNPGELINTVQPKFDAQEHLRWNNHLAQLLVTVAGYAPETWGIQGQTATVQRAVSGYAMKLSQLRTLLNRSQKEHMALQAMGKAIATALAWHLGGKDVDEFLPSIELGDGLPPDPLDGAQEVLFLRQAAAASTEELVRTVHPTWTPERVEAEVDAIMEEGMFPAGSGPATGTGQLLPRLKSLLAGSGDTAGNGVDGGATPVD